MKRISINGSDQRKRSCLVKAFSAMTGLDYMMSFPYAMIAYQYKLDNELSKCQWPDSFVYCLGAFTERVAREQQLEDRFVSDGGVFNELSWIKCRYSHVDLIYEKSMLESLEKVVMAYASKAYDAVFHLESNDSSDVIDRSLKQLYNDHHVKHHIINCINDEEDLCQMLEQLQVKPILSAKYALLKFSDVIPDNENSYLDSD